MNLKGKISVIFIFLVSFIHSNHSFAKLDLDSNRKSIKDQSILLKNLTNYDFPAPAPDINALAAYSVAHDGNLPSVFGMKDIISYPLSELYLTNQMYNSFPIQLNCNLASCHVSLTIGTTYTNNGALIVAAQDDLTKNKISTSIHFQDGNGNPISTQHQLFTIQQNNQTEVIDNSPAGQGTLEALDATPYFTFGHFSPISYVNFPLAPNSYYYFCSYNINNQSESNCTEPKPLFDSQFSGNSVHYLSFWKLEQQGRLSPGTSQNYTFNYSSGLTDTTATGLSWSLGFKYAKGPFDLSANVTESTSYSLSYQKSKSISHTVQYNDPKVQASIGDYVLYSGVNEEFPSVDNFIKDLNSQINNNPEYYFTKLNQFTDSKSGESISSGTAVFTGDNNNLKDGTDTISWSVSVPSNPS